VPQAPYQIRANDLLDPQAIDAAARTDRPCRAIGENQISMFQVLNEVGRYDHGHYEGPDAGIQFLGVRSTAPRRIGEQPHCWASAIRLRPY
jgi:hypothetical protein